MFTLKNFIFLFLYTLLFTLLLFIGREIFFAKVQEEIYLEPQLWEDFENFDEQTGYYSFSGTTQEEVNAAVGKLIYDAYLAENSRENTAQITAHYIPRNLEEKVKSSHVPLLEAFVSFPDISKTIKQLGIYMYKNIGEVRGRMKSQNIHLFWVEKMGEEEFLSVFIHEFWHYFDIYTLKKSQFGDESDKFYEISWESQSQMKKQLQQGDFVSGYAMTNQYEDFAESYVYYILYNRDFFTKAQSSSFLRQKYEFFEKYVFSQKQFYKENFSPEAELKSYYWDITKLPVDIKKFLQYLQNDI